MTRLRTSIFWAHLLTGLGVAAIVLVMAATGVLLTYQRQLQTWADTRGLHAGPPHDGAVPLDPEALLAQVGREHRGVTAVRWRNAVGAPVEVELGRERTLFVDGYTGAVLGEGSARTRAFFRTVTGVHRWLALRDDNRAIGRSITGAANLGFMFMVLSGFYLWWPRHLTVRAFRSAVLFRRGLRPRARDFNWHTVIGFWALIPLTIIIASALVISYAWAGALVERIAGEEPRAATVQPLVAAAPAGRELARGELLLARARARSEAWRTITLQLPARAGAVTFIIDTGSGGQPQRKARLTLSAATGDVVAWEPFASGSRAGRLRSILRYAHTGEVLGPAGQTLAGLVSAVALLLVWTGASLALRRLGAWRKRRERFARAAAEIRAVAGGSRVIR